MSWPINVRFSDSLGTWKTSDKVSWELDMLPTWWTCIIELSAVWITSVWQVSVWETKRLLLGVIWLQKLESKYQERDVPTMVDKAKEWLVLPITHLRMVSRSSKDIEDDTFSEAIESLMVAVVTEVDQKENFPRNWLFNLVACFDCSLRHLEITCSNFFQ